MNIGVLIGRIGDVDGVGLETEKWIAVLKKMGHEIFILSGRFENDVVPKKNQTLWPPLSFFSPDCEWEQNRAFFFPNEDPDELLDHLDRKSSEIAIQIFKWIMTNKIDILLSENSSALPCHLSMGMGLQKAMEKTGIICVSHDHDFYWERGDRYSTPHKKIAKIIKDTFPLNLPNVKHAVINLEAQQSLNKMGLKSIVVPNVMDFNKPYAVKSSYNRDMLPSLGLKEDDIPIFQITRIVERKGIEVAIDMVDRLKDKRIKLVITGSAADDDRKGYYWELKNQIKKKKLNSQVVFGYKKILSERSTSYGGKKIYSLSDAYANATACSYFSTYEGFGNAFIECILAKKPIFVNNYKPVYWTNIGSKGFKTVMLEDNILTDEALSDIEKILHNKKLQEEVGEYNFKLGQKYFSYEVLEEKLQELFQF